MTTRPDLGAIERALQREDYSAEQNAYRDLHHLLTYCRELEEKKRQAEALAAGAYQDGERAIERVGKLEHDLRCLEESTVDRKAFDQMQKEKKRFQEEYERRLDQLEEENKLLRKFDLANDPPEGFSP